jgi:hypothetical protein
MPAWLARSAVRGRRSPAFEARVGRRTLDDEESRHDSDGRIVGRAHEGGQNDRGPTVWSAPDQACRDKASLEWRRIRERAPAAVVGEHVEEAVGRPDDHAVLEGLDRPT